MLGVEAFPLFDGKWASERENRLLIGDLSPPCRFSLHPPSMTMHPICRPPSSFLPTRLDLERIRDRVDKDAVQVKTSASAVRCRCISSSIARSTQASGTGRRRRVRLELFIRFLFKMHHCVCFLFTFVTLVRRGCS